MPIADFELEMQRLGNEAVLSRGVMDPLALAAFRLEAAGGSPLMVAGAWHHYLCSLSELSEAEELADWKAMCARHEV